MERIATHDGLVTKVGTGKVTVSISATSACASCEAHSKCGFAESKDKTLDIPAEDWERYSVGDRVNVHIDESRGLQAVWIAYVLPALLMLAVIIGLSIMGLPEWVVIISTFLILACYTGILVLRRRHISKRFTLTVEPC